MVARDIEESSFAERWWRVASVAILLLAVGLRVASLGYGLDLTDASRTIHNTQLDEREMVKQELELLQGDWHPGKFLWRGTAPFYMAGAVNAVVVGVVAVGSGDGWDATLEGLEGNASLLFYVHRGLVALAGVLTVFVLMRLCRRELGPKAGLVAGLLLATSHLHAQISQVGLVDIPWVLFAMLAFERCLKVLHEPRRSDVLMAGLWIGLAGSTKYPGGLVGTMVLVAFFVGRRALRRTGTQAPPWRMLVQGVSVAVLTFLAFSPRLLIWPEEYLDAVNAQVQVLDVFERSSAYGHVFVNHIRNSLRIGLGEPAMLAIAVGFLVAASRGGGARRVALLALLFIPTAMVAKTAAPRFATGFVAGAIPVATIGLVALMRGRSRAVQALIVAIAIGPSLVRSVAYSRVLDRFDTRLEMLDELAARELPYQDVLAIGHRGLPKSGTKGRKFINLAGKMRTGAMTIEGVLSAPPKYILRDLGSGESEEDVWEPFRAMVEGDYEEIFRVDGRAVPSDEPNAMHGYLLPRTYVPFATPWDARRPGPALVLYRQRMN